MRDRNGRNIQSGGKQNANETPQRVSNAARNMQSDPSFGAYRGYVPQQPYTREQYQHMQQNAEPFPNGRARVNDAVQGNIRNSGMNGAYRGFAPASESQPPKKTPKAPRKIWIWILIIAAVTAAAVFTVSGIQEAKTQKQMTDEVTAYNMVFCDNVFVDGIHLGGMSWEEAVAAVQSGIQKRHDAWKVNLIWDGFPIATIMADMLNMEVDVDSVLHEAWAQGHSGDTVGTRYAEMQELKEHPYMGYTAVPEKDTGIIDEVLGQVKLNIDIPASDAALVSFDPSLPYPFVFSDEVYGRELDIVPLKTQLYEMVSTFTGGDVELVPKTIAPAVTKEGLQKHYMLRSSEYTRISTSSTDDRNRNITRACEKINGYVLQPGKQFSFNKVVGERTTSNGFYPAVEYVYGEHTEGIGGGVCQVSSTVYQAAVCAGLKIVKRRPHSDAVNYTGYGSDATVYWVGKRIIDLVFENNTGEPIYIVAAVQPDPDNKKRLITRVSMYGADMGDVWYRLETRQIAELDPPTEPEYIKDKEGTYVTYTDQQKSVFKPEKGYVYESYRVKYSGTEEIGRELLATDTYDAKPERIYVGVKSRD